MTVRNHNRIAMYGAIILGLGFALNVQAQTTGTETRRDVHQQERIDAGLKSGQLTTKEAAQLERQESRIDRTEQRDMKNGSLSAAEKAKIQAMQNRSNRAIYTQKHDAQTGNGDSRSSERMQADVSRDVRQERRIHNGIDHGSLTNSEAAGLEGRESHVDRTEAHTGANGNVNWREQRYVQRTENRDGTRIWRKKHNETQQH
ncbi:MAG TPA: hypothetical protein VGH80_01535 [Xanthomonadaceae bacterium]|jgi:hypothetical protein